MLSPPWRPSSWRSASSKRSFANRSLRLLQLLFTLAVLFAARQLLANFFEELPRFRITRIQLQRLRQASGARIRGCFGLTRAALPQPAGRFPGYCSAVLGLVSAVRNRGVFTIEAERRFKGLHRLREKALGEQAVALFKQRLDLRLDYPRRSCCWIVSRNCRAPRFPGSRSNASFNTDCALSICPAL